MKLRVALLAGSMYDQLHTVLEDRDVDIVVHADQPTLNRDVARMLRDGERIDLLATHSKHAPSQMQWLQPLDGLAGTSELERKAVDMCRFAGALYCVPRLVEVRIMWARTDRMKTVPDTWDELATSSVVFGFPGREAGLYATFFELVVGAGGQLLDEHGQPCMESPEAEYAIEMLCHLAGRAPADLPGWHFDQVDRALLDGRIGAAGVWPGGWGAIRDSGIALAPHRYPAGSQRRVSHAGCQAWAIPTTCGDVPAALDLLRLLTSAESNALDAQAGNVCAHVAAFAAVQPTSDVDRQRLAVTSAMIDEAMVAYPAHPRFTQVEDSGWKAIHDALRGMRGARSTVRELQARAEAVLR